uniref:Ig-like domain-containing protein n=1 Tax=Calidris pygmaea TaxID=425635 RepID=A0A8C3J476_9CHAR
MGAHRCFPVNTGHIPCASPAASPCTPVHPRASPCGGDPRPSLADPLVLQVPSQVLLEGDELRLRCRGALKISKVQFFHEQEELGGGHRKDTRGATELLLGPLQLHHRGRYHCRQEVLLWHETSSPVTVVVQELFSEPVLRLEGPTEPPEGDPLALRCLSTPSPLRPPTQLQHLFYRNGVKVGGPQRSPQLRLPAMELFHSGNYSCEVRTETNSVRKRSALVTVTVRRVPVSGVSLAAQPPTGQLAKGDRLVLLCSVATGTGPLSFSWHRQGSAAPLATGPRYELRAVQQQDSGHYHCRATNGATVANSSSLGVTVLGERDPQMARREPQVLAGESLNLTCSVQAGTAPVAFSWQRDGRELGRGPVLPLGTVGLAHAGTYRCVATNRLGSQRVFQAISPALTLSVTSPGWGQRQQGTGLGGSLYLSPPWGPHIGVWPPPGLGLTPVCPLSVPSGGHGGQRVPPAPGPSWCCRGLAPPAPRRWVTPAQGGAGLVG